MGAVRFAEREHLALYFHVLAHLDLGRDAASLHDPGLPARPWVEALTRAYSLAPGRVQVHGHPLVCETEDELRAWLCDPGPGLDDEQGRCLCRAIMDAFDREAAEFRLEWRAERAARASVIECARIELTQALSDLRAVLWERSGEAPDLEVLHCQALGRHGRGYANSRSRVVAVSLDEPIEMVLCQVFHEEVHPVSDPAVLGGRSGHARDTRAGTDGFSLHAELELAAIEVGQAIVDARFPRWQPAYSRWRSRFGNSR